MPLVRISVYDSFPSGKRPALADAVYTSMREAIGIPEGDRFVVFTSHSSDALFVDPQFMGANRDERFVLIHITLSRGRSVAQKQALYALIAERVTETASIPSDNIMVVLTENNLEDWSFARGEAQYVLNPPAWARKLDNGD
jgi:phenylpyruvate tautomerase PptA (4-oxalocrotonate tautomerase family)